MADAEPVGRTADLALRSLSAAVMLVVAGAALWVGDWAWTLFVALVAVGVMWEWSTLVEGFSRRTFSRAAWLVGGVFYIGVAASTLALMRQLPGGIVSTLAVVVAVICTDVGAYFAGRAIGGPKIAPRISPSKTWAGLCGGMAGAAIGLYLTLSLALAVAGAAYDFVAVTPNVILSGIFIAIVAQAGDFFESWMKRRAGVKDSGRLLPGHGGLFDRVDGFLSVLFVIGVAMAATVALPMYR